MKKLFSILQQKWIEFKIQLKVAFVYPSTKYYEKVKSIIPATLQLKQGIVIEGNVLLSETIEDIGKYVYIGKDTHIDYCSSIGSFTSISYGVKIGMVNHPLDFVSTSPVFYAKRRGWISEKKFNEGAKGKVVIGNDVLISANVVVLEGVKIGDGAVVGAGAVVNKDIPPYAIVAGVPAKIIRYRFDDEMIKKLLFSEWWNLDDEAIKKQKDYFNNPTEFLTHLQK